MKIVKNVKKKLINLFPINDKSIVFESLNDLDCNSGALYNYILENNLNKVYKITWLIKDKKNIPLNKVKNVKFVNFYKRSFFDKIRIINSKYLIWDNVPLYRSSDKQISIYLTHGFPGIKNAKGLINVPEDCNYVLLTTSKLKKYSKDQFNLTNKTKFINCGLPRNDFLFCKNNELSKLTNKKYSKIILWMPTFRKTKNSNRNDSNKNYDLGIPLLNTNDEVNELNKLLKKYNFLLILKIHGGQDQSVIKLKDLSNFKILTSEQEKEKEINLYKLIACTDALITDYSSVSYDYLLLNKPIGYIISDIKEYKLGFSFRNILDYMPGSHIKNIKDLYVFIDELNLNKDKYKNQRKKVLDLVNDFQDNNNCKRIIDKINNNSL